MHGQVDGETGPEAHPRKGIQPYPRGSPRPDPPLRVYFGRLAPPPRFRDARAIDARTPMNQFAPSIDASASQRGRAAPLRIAIAGLGAIGLKVAKPRDRVIPG